MKDSVLFQGIVASCLHYLFGFLTSYIVYLAVGTPFPFFIETNWFILDLALIILLSGFGAYIAGFSFRLLIGQMSLHGFYCYLTIILSVGLLRVSLSVSVPETFTLFQYFSAFVLIAVALLVSALGMALNFPNIYKVVLCRDAV